MRYKTCAFLGLLALSSLVSAGNTAPITVTGTIVNDVSVSALGPIAFGTLTVSNSTNAKASTLIGFRSDIPATVTVCPDVPSSPDWTFSSGHARNAVPVPSGTVLLSYKLNGVSMPISCMPFQLFGGIQTVPLEATLENQSQYTGQINLTTVFTVVN